MVIALAALAVSPTVVPSGSAQAAHALWPDLAMVPPYDFSIETNGAGRKLLRFTTIIVNIGAGPFQLYGYDDEDDEATIGDILSIHQQIKLSNGTFVTRPSTARMQWADDGHNHWHILGYQQFKLQRLNTEVVGAGAKTGFCSLDSYPYGSGKPGVYVGANWVCQVAPNGRVPMGTSRRWGDIYGSDLAFQWVDVTGLPNGTYKLKVIADPPYKSGGRFLESDDTNNRSWTRIRISGNNVTILAKSAKP